MMTDDGNTRWHFKFGPGVSSVKRPDKAPLSNVTLQEISIVEAIWSGRGLDICCGGTVFSHRDMFIRNLLDNSFQESFLCNFAVSASAHFSNFMCRSALRCGDICVMLGLLKLLQSREQVPQTQIKFVMNHWPSQNVRAGSLQHAAVFSERAVLRAAWREDGVMKSD